MHVVLKPGGVVILLGAAATLAYFAFSGPPSGEAKKDNKIARPALRVGTARNLLQNEDFEGPFNPAVVDRAKSTSKITGEVAFGWSDNSGWADVDVAYTPETNNPHGGKSCQKITAMAIRKGQVQFAQYSQTLPGKKVHASVWVRAEKSTRIEFGLRDSATYDRMYNSKEVTVGTQWQKLDAEGTITGKSAVTLLLIMKSPGTVWVDDGSLTIVH